MRIPYVAGAPIACLGLLCLSSAATAQANLFVATNPVNNVSSPANEIFSYTPGGVQSTFATGLNNPLGLAFDGSGNLYESDEGTETIQKFTPDGVQSNFAGPSGLGNPYSEVFDKSGNLYVADEAFGKIFKYTPGGVQTTFASGLDGPEGLAIDASGNIYVGQMSGIIEEYTPGGVGTPYNSFVLNIITDLAFNASGDLFVDEAGGGGRIYEFTSGSSFSIFYQGLSIPEGMAFGSNGMLYEADFGSGNVFEYDTSGNQSVFASGLRNPTSLAFANSGPAGTPEPGSIALFSGLIFAGGMFARRRARTH